MCKTYETIYEDDHLQWLGAQLGAGRHRLRITIIDDSSPQHSPQEGHRMLEATRGAWGRGKKLEDIDAEIGQMRAEWDREARRP